MEGGKIDGNYKVGRRFLWEVVLSKLSGFTVVFKEKLISPELGLTV